MTRHLFLLTSVFCLLTSSFSFAEIKLTPIDYTEGGTALQGFLAYDDAVTQPRPAVLVVPEWWGLTEYPKIRARQLAELGYVAFVADMYGKGVATDDPKKAGELATPFFTDRAKMRARAQAALDTMKQQKQVDKDNLAAIGYCFGGTTVLELARANADPNLKAVIPFHGVLSPGNLPAPDHIAAHLQIHTGAADPMVPQDQIVSFVHELETAKADYQLNLYARAQHAFTNPDADAHHTQGIAYNKEADTRSWAAMKSFLAETLGPIAAK